MVKSFAEPIFRASHHMRFLHRETGNADEVVRHGAAFSSPDGSKLLRSTRCCHATGPRLLARGLRPAAAAMARVTNHRRVLAPATTAVVAGSPRAAVTSALGRLRPAATQPRQLSEAKPTTATERQNPEGRAGPWHCNPCPPACPVPQFPQSNSTLLRCPPWRSAKGSVAAASP